MQARHSRIGLIPPRLLMVASALFFIWSTFTKFNSLSSFLTGSYQVIGLNVDNPYLREPFTLHADSNTSSTPNTPNEVEEMPDAWMKVAHHTQHTRHTRHTRSTQYTTPYSSTPANTALKSTLNLQHKVMTTSVPSQLQEQYTHAHRHLSFSHAHAHAHTNMHAHTHLFTHTTQGSRAGMQRCQSCVRSSLARGMQRFKPS